MRISPIATIGFCLLSSALLSAETKKTPEALAPPAPSAYTSASTTASGDPELMQPSVSDTAKAMAAAPASPTASAQAVSPAAAAGEPEIEDDAQKLSPTAALDLSKAETRLLAKISESIGVDQESILFNLEDNAPADKPGIGVNEVNGAALFLELARRAVADEKEARQALSLAIVRGDKRAKEAKTEAYEERLADSLIKRIQNGDKGAKDELMKLALAGNKNARLFLSLDKPAPVAIPEAVTGTAKADSTPSPVSPAAKVPAEEHKPASKNGGY